MRVNVYEVERHYGGPEEGGWWFDEGTPVASVMIEDDSTDDEIHAEIDAMREIFPRTDRRYSVRGGRDYSIFVEDGLPEPYPAERPYYC